MRQPNTLAMLLLCTVVLAALSPVCRAQPEPMMYAHFINVGQADATLLEFPCGAILIDAGAQDEEHVEILLGYLSDFFDSRRPDLNNTLSSIIITHNHLDHTRALREVVEKFTVERYIDNGQLGGSGTGDPSWVRNNANTAGRNITLREISDADIVSLPHKDGLTDPDIDPLLCDNCDPEIRILSGRLDENPGWPRGKFGNKNNHSLVIRVDFGEASFLFTGDLEEDAIGTLVDYYEDTPALDIDVYQVGHHGSNNGTTALLLEALTPDIAVISVGRWDFSRGESVFTTFNYGHPRKDVIGLLQLVIPKRRSDPLSAMVATGSRSFSPYTIRKKIYATAWDGNVVVGAMLSGSYRVVRYAVNKQPRYGSKSPPVSSAVGFVEPTEPTRSSGNPPAFALFLPRSAASGSHHTFRLAIGDEEKVSQWADNTASMRNHQDDQRIFESLDPSLASHVLIVLKGPELTVTGFSPRTKADPVDQLAEYIWYAAINSVEAWQTVDVRVTPYSSPILEKPGLPQTSTYGFAIVEPSWIQTVREFARHNWQWLWTAVVFPLAALGVPLWRKRRKLLRRRSEREIESPNSDDDDKSR